MVIHSAGITNVGYMEDGTSSCKYVVEVSNSDSFEFTSDDEAMDIEIMGPDIFSSVSTKNAKTITIANNDGINIAGDGDFYFDASLGINNEMCDMIGVEGNGTGSVSLGLSGSNVLISGKVEDGTITVFSDTVDVDKYKCPGDSNDVLIAGDGSGVAGRIVIKGETQYTFTRAAGVGGTVSGTASGDYSQGTAISVTATANSGYHFKNWTVSGATITGGNTANPATFNMPAGAVTLTANFEADGGTTPGTVDKTDLNAKIAEAESKANDARYTDASRAALQTAITSAKAIVNKSDATQTEVNNALNALNTAYNGLQLKKGILGTNAKWYGAWWHYLLFFLCFGFIWMW